MGKQLAQSLTMPDGNDYHFFGVTYFGACTTIGSAQQKVAYINGFNLDSYINGVVIFVRFSNTNTHNAPYLNVNGTISYPIYIMNPNGTSTSWKNIPSGVVQLMFANNAWFSVHPIYDGAVMDDANGVSF